MPATLRQDERTGGGRRESGGAPSAPGSGRILRLGRFTLPLGGRTLVMGILNVTPDSFSDGGRFLDPLAAVEHALEMTEAGADIIDVGGESSRPGAEAVGAEEEWHRIGPVVASLAARGLPVSVDTYKALVARRALDAGAVLINDISGGTLDPGLHGQVAAGGGALVVMHILGNPRTMQQHPEYDDLMSDIRGFLVRQTGAALAAGVSPDSIIIDPGIGFGKRPEHNLEIIGRLGVLRALPYPILVGPSRKSFIGWLTGLPPQERLEGSVGASVAAALYGADMVRVHDVRATARALAVADAVRRAAHGEGGVWI